MLWYSLILQHFEIHMGDITTSPPYKITKCIREFAGTTSCHFPWRACLILLCFRHLRIDFAANILANVNTTVQFAAVFFFFISKLISLFAGHILSQVPRITAYPVMFCSPKLVWCCSNLLNQSLFKNRQKTTLADVWSPSGFVTIAFCVTCTKGLCSQISSISGLTRELHIVLDSQVVRTANALGSNQVYLQKRIVSWTEERTGSRCINHVRDFLFCQKWVVFPNGLTAAKL